MPAVAGVSWRVTVHLATIAGYRRTTEMSGWGADAEAGWGAAGNGGQGGSYQRGHGVGSDDDYIRLCSGVGLLRAAVLRERFPDVALCCCGGGGCGCCVPYT